MVNQETANIKLTTEQLLQIDYFQKHLANLQSEILIHTKSIEIVKNDNDRLSKEKTYLEELISNLDSKKSELERNVESLSNSLSDKQKELENTVIEHTKTKDVILVELEKLEACRQDLSDKQNVYDANKLDLDAKISLFQDESNLLEDKKRKIQELLKSL